MGIPELRKAMAEFYKRWYDVDLDWATEIQPLIGSKEGILHVTLAFCNPGDEVLIPEPGLSHLYCHQQDFGYQDNLL